MESRLLQLTSVGVDVKRDVGQDLKLCFQVLIVASHYSLASLAVLAAFMLKVASDICLHRLIREGAKSLTRREEENIHVASMRTLYVCVWYQ